MSDVIFGGVEGGGTHSKVVLVNGNGTILCYEEFNFSTSHFLVGMETCQHRLYEMVQMAKSKAGLPENVPINGLGLSLSGCEQEETNEQMKRELKARFPDLSEHYKVVSDTVGSIVTVNPDGGIVLISGTGSNALLLNPDGSTHRCGGWGWLLGDEGSAYWLAYRATKLIVDEDDNFTRQPYDSKLLRKIIYEHFQIKDNFGLLDHAYTKFDKAFFAAVTRKISEGAQIHQDLLCKELFREAGILLGRHLLAMSSNVHPTLLEQDGGLHIICIGQMWRSWDLIKKGLLEGLTNDQGNLCFQEFTLLKLQTSLALGAAYLGAKVAGHVLPMKPGVNAQAFYHHKVTGDVILTNGESPIQVKLKKDKAQISEVTLIHG